MDELTLLWNQGIPTHDALKKKTFNIRATVMWTINDFLAYDMLFGWRTKSKFACPNCAFDTKSARLKHGHKECYLDHRRWLLNKHRYCSLRKLFDGKVELRKPPIPMTGSTCLASLSGLTFEVGKGKKKSVTNNANMGIKGMMALGRRKACFGIYHIGRIC